MQLVKYTVKSWPIINREILSLRAFKDTYLALIFHLILLIRGILNGKRTQCLRKLECIKKLATLLLVSCQACEHDHMTSVTSKNKSLCAAL